jgi:hypothetical protein
MTSKEQQRRDPVNEGAPAPVSKPEGAPADKMSEEEAKERARARKRLAEIKKMAVRALKRARGH